ncbi:DUF2061 domain-containing protein [Winogradskyella psychrotolerans]|uniref:DUF2061 domain-containing protein n=1 Tax=Winogradskyella psychrotolerans TaxID=1344585 RepID=UPI001C07CA62|nr:DUF2061 domain-containing protein [Winogradskyella psychrotolerans]MBU2922151.1 DUF2061 domain-containing protein [Winogradskyella psychrotolerans]
MKFSKRHLAKTITWRIIGTLDTMLLSWFISGNFSIGMKMGLYEMVTKMVLYYLHERVWFKSTIKSSNKRHILKTFSWRGVGTLDTIILGWVISGNPLTGLKIGGAEVVTKMLLYFGHEKLWYQINFGLDQRNKRKQVKNVNEL